MNGRDDTGGTEVAPGKLSDEGQTEATPPAGPPRAGRKRRKVSLIGAIIVNVITLITLAIILLAVLLPGYRRSFTMARAVEGAEEVLIVVRISEETIRDNNAEFLPAQDGLKNAMQELVGSGGDNVWAYVRDNFPDQAWIQRNLPENMRQWLEELYPKPEEDSNTSPNGNGGETPVEEQPAEGTSRP